MSTSDQTKDISTVVKKLRAEYPTACATATATNSAAATVTGGATTDVSCCSAIEPDEPVLAEFVRSMLLWECTTAKASAALKRIEDSVVDYNELRICLPDELMRLMGERYPRAEERSLRLRAPLNEVFIRQHSVSLRHLMTLGKREAKEYLDSIEGVPRFVSARVALLCLGGHAAPVDSRVLKRLIEGRVVEASATAESAAGLLERNVRAGELLETYHLLQAWADDAPLTLSDPHIGDGARAKKDPKGTVNGRAGSGLGAGGTNSDKRRGAKDPAKDPTKRK